LITCEKLNLKNQSKNESKGSYLRFYNYAYVKSAAVAVRTYKNMLNSWICTSTGKFYRYGGFKGIVNGTKPTSCTRMAINNVGEIYVVDKKGGLSLLMFIAQNSWIWKTVLKKDAVDVSVGFNGETYIVDTKGDVYNIMKDKKGKKFGKKNFGKGCKSIAVSYENEQIAYVVDKKGDLYRNTAKKSSKLYPSIVVNDVDVDSYNNLYIASGLGIYMKRPMNSFLAQIGDGIAKLIDCDSRRCWIIGEDEYVYASTYIKTW